jgi:2-polyprenyl-6-methoxyphenol hydroxylase-like FAD-dependent oxidoreductase
MSTEPIGAHAVVLGAGMAGLLTARILADLYDEVIVIDRDDLPAGAQGRLGVPQGAHAHALLARGVQLLDELFPGFTADLVADGATVGDVLGDVRMSFSGHRLSRSTTGLTALSVSRPFLEAHVRARVEQLGTVTLLQRCDVLGLVAASDRRRIVGVRLLRRRDHSAEELMATDTVVDATGRLSRAPAWLDALGIDAAREDRVEVGLAYASRRYRLDRTALGGDIAIIHGLTPDRPRGGVVAALESGTGLLTLAGLGDDRPPTDPDRFVEFARSLAESDIYDAIRHAEPLDDPVPFRFPASVRRRYEQHRKIPDGFACLGDSFCCLNPVYGQGMTLATQSAVALGRHLRRHRRLRPRWLHHDLAAVVEPAWQMVTGADRALPDVPGRPSAGQRLVGRYVGRLHAAATTDPELSAAFVRVSGLVDPPRALLRPSIARRVLARRPDGGSWPRRSRSRRHPTLDG